MFKRFFKVVKPEEKILCDDNNFEQSDMNIQKSNKNCKNHVIINENVQIDVPDRCATAENLMDFSRFEIQNNNFVCSVCDWTSINNSMEDVLAHTKTPFHKMNLRKRFQNLKKEVSGHESSMEKNQKVNHLKQNQETEDFISFFDSELHLNSSQQDFSPKNCRKRTRNKTKICASSKIQNCPSKSLDKLNDLGKDFENNLFLHNKHSNLNIIEPSTTKQKIHKQQPSQKTRSSSLEKEHLSETLCSCSKSIRFSQNFESSTTKPKGRITSELPNQKLNKNLIKSETDVHKNLKKKNSEKNNKKCNNIVRGECNIGKLQNQKSEAKFSCNAKNQNIFENVASNSNCNSQNVKFNSTASKPNFENKKTFHKKEDFKAVANLFSEKEAVNTLVLNKILSNSTCKTEAKASKYVKENTGQSTSSTALEKGALPIDMSFISFTPDNKAKCELCQITLPVAKEFKHLLENVSCHINGTKHTKNKHALRVTLSQTVEALT